MAPSASARGRDTALAVWRAALAAGDPARLVTSSLHTDGTVLAAGPFSLALDGVRRIVVLGCGKAGGAMAQAVEAVLGERIDDGFVIVKDGYTRRTRRVRLVEASHPVPDARGEAAAETLLGLAERAGADDLVVFLVSGGGSALTPAPAPPVTLEEKQTVTRLLLAAGATIRELNAVRKHLSRIKGGQLARAAAPARLVTLALSDVIGDPLDVIASGPTAPDPTTFRDALDVLERRGVRSRAPGTVLARLDAGAHGEIDETPKAADPLFSRVANVVIGNNTLVTDAAMSAATRLGLRAELLTRALEGEAREVASEFVARVRAMPRGTCLIAGGETTVTVRRSGSGGRCQEFALAAAIAIAGADDIVVLAAGTDGTDGPTDAAGAVVDATTVSRAAVRGFDAAAALDANDSAPLLAAIGDAIVTGPTNTNLLDVYIALRA